MHPVYPAVDSFPDPHNCPKSDQLYLAEKLHVKTENDSKVLERNKGRVNTIDYKLGTSRGGFMYRGSKLVNSLPKFLRVEPSLEKFGVSAIKWVTETIPIRL